MSTVNKVLHELKTEASELIRAASNPAATRPRKPDGNRLLINTGKAHVLFDGGRFVSHCNSPFVFKVRAMIPGTRNKNTGISFNNDPQIAPLLPSLRFLAVNVL